MDELKEKFKNFLKKRGYKVTSSRLNIIDILRNYERHFEIEDLVNYITINSKAASRATVYRTVKLLLEFGVIREVIKQSNKTIYEFEPFERHHDHLVCERCGSIIEFANEEIEDIQEKVCKDYEFHPTRHRLEIFGICKDCYKKIFDYENK